MIVEAWGQPLFTSPMLWLAYLIVGAVVYVVGMVGTIRSPMMDDVRQGPAQTIFEWLAVGIIVVPFWPVVVAAWGWDEFQWRQARRRIP